MYSITKHAVLVIAFSETIREELKRYYQRKVILVSTLVPGFVDTNIMKTSSEILNVIKNTDIYIRIIKAKCRIKKQESMLIL